MLKATKGDPQRELPHEIPVAVSELAQCQLNNHSLRRTQLSAAFKEPRKPLFNEYTAPMIGAIRNLNTDASIDSVTPHRKVSS